MSPLEDVRGIDGAEDLDDGEASEDEGYEDGPDGEGSPGGPAGPRRPDVHEVTVERPRRRRRGRRGRRRRRPEDEPKPDRKMLTYVVVAAVIIASIGFAWFFWGPAGSIAKIDLIARPYTDDATSTPGMSLAAFIDAGKPSSLSGTADLRVSWNGTGVYSGQVGVSESRAIVNVPLNKFVIGNGDYRVLFTYQGFTTATVFSVTDIIEKMNMTAFNLTSVSSPAAVQPGSARLGVTMTFLNNDDFARYTSKNDRIEIEIIRNGVSEKHPEVLGNLTQFSINYSVAGNGNYTMKASFTNSKVKPGSQYSRIDGSATDYQTRQPYVIVTIPPTANAGADKSLQWKVADGGAVVSFDGTASVAYEGATIDHYAWDFGDFTGDEGAKVTHTYTSVPATGQPLVYDATLIITDSNGQFASDKVQITVRL